MVTALAVEVRVRVQVMMMLVARMRMRAVRVLVRRVALGRLGVLDARGLVGLLR